MLYILFLGLVLVLLRSILKRSIVKSLYELLKKVGSDGKGQGKMVKSQDLGAIKAYYRDIFPEDVNVCLEDLISEETGKELRNQRKHIQIEKKNISIPLPIVFFDLNGELHLV